MNNFESIGTWWNDDSIELIKIDGEIYALDGWNGETYTESWKCVDEYTTVDEDVTYSITEVSIADDNGEFKTVGFNVCKN